MLSIFIVGIVVVILIPDVKGAYAACFSSEKDVLEYLQAHQNDTEYSVIFPCPDKANLLNQTIEKDESNKWILKQELS